ARRPRQGREEGGRQGVRASLGGGVGAVLEQGGPLGEHAEGPANGGADLWAFQVERLELALDPPVELLEGQLQVLGRLLRDLQAQGLVLEPEQDLAVLADVSR